MCPECTEKEWYARQDSNLRPLVPETNALSMLSYGRMGFRFRSLAESAPAVDLLLVSKQCPSRHRTARSFFSEEVPQPC